MEINDLKSDLLYLVRNSIYHAEVASMEFTAYEYTSDDKTLESARRNLRISQDLEMTLLERIEELLPNE